MKKLTPVLAVDAIEPVLPFWEGRLGFTRTMQMPDEGPLEFVILTHGATEVMYQTHASIATDVPALGPVPTGGTLLFVEVDDLDAVEAALAEVPLVTPRRVTFYGSHEVIVREPGGHVVTFAQFVGAPA